MPTSFFVPKASLAQPSVAPRSIRWSLALGSDLLSLSHDLGEGLDGLRLAPEQAAAVRALGGTTQCLRIPGEAGSPGDIFLIGKKTGIGLWSGLACRADDVEAVVSAMQQALHFADQIVSEVNALVVVIDRNYKVRRFNRLCEEGSGMRESELIGMDAHHLFLPPAHQADARAHVADFFDRGESFETITPVNSPLGERQIQWRNKLLRCDTDAETYLVCSGIDVTDDLSNRQRLHEQATRDATTGLPNAFTSRQHLDAAIEAGRPLVFMTLVVVNYRSLRGMLGLARSESLMRQVALALAATVPQARLLSRIGGPEFCLHFDGSLSDEELAPVCEQVLHALSQTFSVAGTQVRLQVAIGGARFPEDAATADDLQTAADAAMHSAMARAHSSFELYATGMRDELARGLWLDSQLHGALDQGQFELWYQPKISMLDGSVNSVEALIRWKHPEIGYIAPDQFIPRSEATGFIVRIGRWVAHTAALQARAWAVMNRELRVSVNVSAKQITQDPLLIEVLKEAQSHCGGLLDVELTESSFLDNALDAQVFIERCRSLGCGVHLDDFGAGYSSLGQLAGLELTAVKLDRAFIADRGSAPKQRAMLEAISHLAAALGLDVIAEGVETEEMAGMLRSIGVQYSQGWHYSKAVSAPDLLNWLDGHEAGPARQAASGSDELPAR